MEKWEERARTLLQTLEPEIGSIMAYFGVERLYVKVGGTPDIACLPGLETPILVIGRKWVEAGSDEERLKRVVHEVAGHIAYGIEHGLEARTAGYFSKPERDTKSWEWYKEWRTWQKNQGPRMGGS